MALKHSCLLLTQVMHTSTIVYCNKLFFSHANKSFIMNVKYCVIPYFHLILFNRQEINFFVALLSHVINKTKQQEEIDNMTNLFKSLIIARDFTSTVCLNKDFLITTMKSKQVGPCQISQKRYSNVLLLSGLLCISLSVLILKLGMLIQMKGVYKGTLVLAHFHL